MAVSRSHSRNPAGRRHRRGPRTSKDPSNDASVECKDETDGDHSSELFAKDGSTASDPSKDEGGEDTSGSLKPSSRPKPPRQRGRRTNEQDSNGKSGSKSESRSKSHSKTTTTTTRTSKLRRSRSKSKTRSKSRSRSQKRQTPKGGGGDSSSEFSAAEDESGNFADVSEAFSAPASESFSVSSDTTSSRASSPRKSRARSRRHDPADAASNHKSGTPASSSKPIEPIDESAEFHGVEDDSGALADMSESLTGDPSSGELKASSKHRARPVGRSRRHAHDHDAEVACARARKQKALARKRRSASPRKKMGDHRNSRSIKTESEEGKHHSEQPKPPPSSDWDQSSNEFTMSKKSSHEPSKKSSEEAPLSKGIKKRHHHPKVAEKDPSLPPILGSLQIDVEILEVKGIKCHRSSDPTTTRVMFATMRPHTNSVKENNPRSSSAPAALDENDAELYLHMYSKRTSDWACDGMFLNELDKFTPETKSLKMGYEEARHLLQSKAPLEVRLVDVLSQNSTMDSAQIPLLGSDKPRWYQIVEREPEFGAPPIDNGETKGKLRVRVGLKAELATELQRGCSLELNPERKLVAKLRWKAERDIRLDYSCVAIDENGQISWGSTVYLDHSSNRTSSLQLRDVQTVAQTKYPFAYSQELEIRPKKVADYIKALYLVATVRNGDSFHDLASMQVRLMDFETRNLFGRFAPLLKDKCALILMRLTRSSNDKWVATPISKSYPLMREFQQLIPAFKSLTRDIVPKYEEVTANDSIVPLSCLRRPIRLNSQTFRIQIAYSVLRGRSAGMLLDRDGRLVRYASEDEPCTKLGVLSYDGKENLAENFCMDLSKNSGRVQYVAFTIGLFQTKVSSSATRRVSFRLMDGVSGRLRALCQISVAPTAPLLLFYMYRKDNEWHLQAVGQTGKGLDVGDAAVDWRDFLQQEPPQYQPYEPMEETFRMQHLTMPESTDLVKSQDPIPPEDIPKYVLD